ncbi:MAG: SUMF1/EgtB/PvdO family nonheme iron enzyme [Gammaproteobacteria bacterium]|nr:SUMF1/EgtB/PvdO family nonheme iron enzyme [Gammaproteobacteria bacterium]
MVFLGTSDQATRQARRKTRNWVLAGMGTTAALAVVMFLLFVRAQTSLNQVTAFVHANKLDQLKGECPLVFAPDTLGGEQLVAVGIERCAMALRGVRELVGNLDEHRNTVNSLEENEDQRDSFQHQTVVDLVDDLESIEDVPLLRKDVEGSIETLKRLAEAVRTAREVARYKTACALLFSPAQAAFPPINAKVAPCRQALDDLRLVFKKIGGLPTQGFRDAQKTLGDLRHPDLNRFLDDLEWLPAFLEEGRLERKIERVMAAVSDEVWSRAIESIAVSPRYAGLKLKPRVGLLPLGLDSGSGLWEFAHVLSGEVPQRGADGGLDVTAETGIVLVLIPGGRFEMGSGTGDQDERPIHRVTVRPFFIAPFRGLSLSSRVIPDCLRWRRIHTVSKQ